MKMAFHRFRSMSTNEQLGMLVVGIMCYCFGLIPLWLRSSRGLEPDKAVNPYARP